jgi:hypothetical protein
MVLTITGVVLGMILVILAGLEPLKQGLRGKHLNERKISEPLERPFHFYLVASSHCCRIILFRK